MLTNNSIVLTNNIANSCYNKFLLYTTKQNSEQKRFTQTVIVFPIAGIDQNSIKVQLIKNAPNNESKIYITGQNSLNKMFANNYCIESDSGSISNLDVEFNISNTDMKLEDISCDYTNGCLIFVIRKRAVETERHQINVNRFNNPKYQSRFKSTLKDTSPLNDEESQKDHRDRSNQKQPIWRYWWGDSNIDFDSLWSAVDKQQGLDHIGEDFVKRYNQIMNKLNKD